MDLKQQLDDLRKFVWEEREANYAKLTEIWDKPLSQKLESGESQRISNITVEDKHHLLVTLGGGESRFREGDMLCLHLGNVPHTSFVRQASIEAEQEGEWLLYVFDLDPDAVTTISEPCFADPDSMDQRHFFEKAFDDLASTPIGTDVVLPLLAGRLDASYIYPDNYDKAADIAEERGLNDSQIDAVGKGVAAQYLSCIQGPPGTGKTKVISLIAKLLAEEGHAILITSHTHMAINNALNKVAKEGVTTAKVGALSGTKGLDATIPRCDYAIDWEDKPDNGYVIGATPFATCSERLESFEFDTIIFDEASQITVPLAVMAMRKGKRFVFVGDHKQLPPVVLSKSVLDGESYSVFSRLVLGNSSTAAMLKQTYRMNSDLSHWPSQQYYNGNLVAVGENANRQFMLPTRPQRHMACLSSSHSLVFIKSPGINARTSSASEAELVVDIIANAVEAGMPLENVGVVTPFRNHGKNIKGVLADKFGMNTAKTVVTDTVERMQGQEREMIILSLCSTDVQFISAVASFFFQAERLNVAITRAMTKLVIIGPELSATFSVDSNEQLLLEGIEAYRSLVNAAYYHSIGE